MTFQRSRVVFIAGDAGYICSRAGKALSRAGSLPLFYNVVYAHEWAVKCGALVRVVIFVHTALARHFQSLATQDEVYLSGGL
jgi:hypothetical protein